MLELKAGGRGAWPISSFLLSMERKSYKRQQITLNAVPSTHYINISYVCEVLAGLSCTEQVLQ